MIKRRLYYILAWAGASIGTVVILWGLFVGVTLRLGQDEIQAKIDAQLPTINEKLAHDGKSVRIEQLSVDVHNNELTIHAVVHGKKFGKDFDVSALASGTPRYVPTEGAFYFEPSAISIEEVRFSGSSIQSAVRGAADRYVTNSGLRNLIDDNAEKVEVWARQVTQSMVTHVLERMPVYKLKDDGKGVVALALLDTLTIEGDEVVVHLTLVRLMWWTFVGLLAVVCSIAMLFALVTNPELGAAMLIIGSFGS